MTKIVKKVMVLKFSKKFFKKKSFFVVTNKLLNSQLLPQLSYIVRAVAILGIFVGGSLRNLN